MSKKIITGRTSTSGTKIIKKSALSSSIFYKIELKNKKPIKSFNPDMVKNLYYMYFDENTNFNEDNINEIRKNCWINNDNMINLILKYSTSKTNVSKIINFIEKDFFYTAEEKITNIFKNFHSKYGIDSKYGYILEILIKKKNRLSNSIRGYAKHSTWDFK